MLLKFTHKGKFLLQIGGRSESKGNADTKSVHQSGRRLRVAEDQRSVRRRRLRQPPRHRVRRRHRRVQADVGRVRQRAGMRSAARRAAALAAGGAGGGAAAGGGRGAAPALDTDGPGSPSSSAGRCTPSRCRTTGSSTSPTVRTAACRCSRRTASTSTQVFINRSGPVGAVGGRLRVLARRGSSSSSTSPTTATRTSPCSIARACRCSISSAQRSEKPGDFQGLHHMAIDSKGNLYTGEVAPGRARAAIRAQGTVEHPAAQRAHAAQLAAPPCRQAAAPLAHRAAVREVSRPAGARQLSARGPARWRIRTG